MLDDIAQGFITGFHALFFRIFSSQCDTHLSIRTRNGEKKKNWKIISTLVSWSPEDYYYYIMENFLKHVNAVVKVVVDDWCKGSSTFRFLKPIKGDRNNSQFSSIRLLSMAMMMMMMITITLGWLNIMFVKKLFRLCLCHLSLDLNLGQWDKAYSIHSVCLNTDEMRKWENTNVLYSSSILPSDCVLSLFSTNRQSSS